MTEGRIRLLLADDHAMFRAGLCSLLATQPDLDVVGEARTGEEAANMAAALRPDVVLMDIAMPGSGIDATRAICGADARVHTLCLSAHDDPAYFFAALDAGAVGYVLKEAGPPELFDAIRAAHRGEAYFSPALRACS